jgi:hypothetical protein
MYPMEVGSDWRVCRVPRKQVARDFGALEGVPKVRTFNINHGGIVVCRELEFVCQTLRVADT